MHATCHGFTACRDALNTLIDALEQLPATSTLVCPRPAQARRPGCTPSQLRARCRQFPHSCSCTVALRA